MNMGLQNSVCTTVSEIFNSSNITIGKPISNTSIKIINKDSQGIGGISNNRARTF